MSPARAFQSSRGTSGRPGQLKSGSGPNRGAYRDRRSKSLYGEEVVWHMTPAGRALQQFNRIMQEVGGEPLDTELAEAIIRAVIRVEPSPSRGAIIRNGEDQNPFLYLLMQGMARVEFPIDKREQPGRGLIQCYNLFGWSCIDADGEVLEPCHRNGTVYAQGTVKYAVIDVRLMSQEMRKQFAEIAAEHHDRMERQAAGQRR